MSFFEILTVVTCATSTITMIIVAVAVLPHFKNGLAILRDAVLWVSLVLILAGMGFVGWQHVMRQPSKPTAQASQSSASSLTAGR